VQGAAVALTFLTVFTLSFITFSAIKATIGLRVSEEEEDSGLDIAEHGMYGYPEQFIPSAELVGYGGGPTATVPPAPVPSLATKESPA
jgi:Amt family ammonium transporter